MGRKPSFEYVTRVGGVAFDAIAKPKDLEIEEFEIFYSPVKEDGSRLRIGINGIVYSPLIYDWQLVPIASFSDSMYSGAFTLFGELGDKEKTNLIVENGGRVLNYAPPFEDTLIGLRLFQLDVLLVDKQLAKGVPTYKGKYVLGAGESQPNIEKRKSR